jgi:hypothetical protein
MDYDNYRSMIAGILHGILWERKSDEYFQYLFVVNKDNYESFLKYLVEVISI